MAYKVIAGFHDKDTKKHHAMGSFYQGSEARCAELVSKKHLEKVKDAPKKSEEAKVSKENKSEETKTEKKASKKLRKKRRLRSK